MQDPIEALNIIINSIFAAVDETAKAGLAGTANVLHTVHTALIDIVKPALEEKAAKEKGVAAPKHQPDHEVVAVKPADRPLEAAPNPLEVKAKVDDKPADRKA